MGRSPSGPVGQSPATKRFERLRRESGSLATYDYLDRLPGGGWRRPVSEPLLRVNLDHLPFSCVRGQHEITFLVGRSYVGITSIETVAPATAPRSSSTTTPRTIAEFRRRVESWWLGNNPEPERAWTCPSETHPSRKQTSVTLPSSGPGLRGNIEFPPTSDHLQLSAVRRLHLSNVNRGLVRSQ